MLVNELHLVGTPEYKNLISDIRKTASEHGVEVILGSGKFINYDGTRVQGYFCNDTLQLRAASKNTMFVSTLLHESCHMDQWIEKCPYWNDDVMDSFYLYTDILGGADIPQSDIDHAMSNIAMLEADCEARTIAKIKQYNLPIDPELYARLANGYLYFHTALAKYRKWYRSATTPSKMGITNDLPSVVYEPEHYRIGNHDVDPDIYLPCIKS